MSNKFSISLNKFLKCMAEIPVHMLVLLYSWLYSFLATAILASAVFGIWSIFAALPVMFLTKYWAILLTATIPLTIVFFVIIEIDYVDKFEVDK